MPTLVRCRSFATKYREGFSERDLAANSAPVGTRSLGTFIRGSRAGRVCRPPRDQLLICFLNLSSPFQQLRRLSDHIPDEDRSNV